MRMAWYSAFEEECERDIQQHAMRYDETTKKMHFMDGDPDITCVTNSLEEGGRGISLMYQSLYYDVPQHHRTNGPCGITI